LIETLEQLEGESNPIFDDAIYSYGDLKFGEGSGSGAIAQVLGSVRYEGNLTNGKNINVTPQKKEPPTPSVDILEPASLIPGGVTELMERTTSLPKNISAANNGYYKQKTTWSGNYTVDTSAGDVILMFSSIDVKSNSSYSFTVTGGFNLDGNMNNETPFTITNPASNIYFVIDQPVSQRDPMTNVMSFSLGKNKITMDNMYLYAPFTSILFKNNFEYNGSIVVGGLELKNNAEVTYKPSSDNPSTPGEEIYIGEQIPIPVSGVNSMNYNGGSYWLKR